MNQFMRVRRRLRRQWRRGPGVLVAMAVMIFGTVGWLSILTVSQEDIITSLTNNMTSSGLDASVDGRSLHRKLLSSATGTQDSQDSDATTQIPVTTTKKSEYPPDVFSMHELKHGAVVLYILGMLYMFFALAIVCDEFFVPSLEVIIVVIDLSADVAGATFMAAGGSMPELFTSLIAVFAAYSDVGVGTIVGSAVFNIMFVIGMCALFSNGVLALTWWPLFRDVAFYSLSLICLILGFLDGKIWWNEAIIMMCCYFAYVTFMKFNHTVESWVKTLLNRNQVMMARSSDNLMVPENQNERRCSIPMLKGSSKFRHGVLQLMIHTIDPLGEAKVHEKAVKLQQMASLKEMMANADNNANNARPSGAVNGTVTAISNGRVHENNSTPRNMSQQTTMTTVGIGMEDSGPPNPSSDSPLPPPSYTNGHVRQNGTNGNGNGNGNGAGAITMNGNAGTSDEDDRSTPEARSQMADDFEESEPLDMSWPDTWRRRVTYIILAPIVFPLWLTLPDVRKPEKRKYYTITFAGSMLWIAGFSYLLNWWANTTGKVFDIPDAVMGLTFLAAGTSIPDLITSVIVAKKGFGDMAVSSSVGSNIFDVTIGLPVPWLLHGIIRGIPYTVSSDGLFCSIVLLFIMLLMVIVLIAAFRWQMNKMMGFTMLALYCIFLTLALLLEFNVIECPL